jgi:gas vesicle protein
MRLPFRIAFLNPLNLAVLGLSAVAGLCAAWWLFPLGLVAWVIMFLIIYRDPGLQFIQVSQSRAPLNQRFQKLFDRIARSQANLFYNLASGKTNFKRSVQPLQEAVNQLTDQAYTICSRMTMLQNYYVVTKSNRDFKGELFNLKVKIDNTADDVTRRKLEVSQAGVEEEQKNFEATEALLDRVEAQLTSISSTMDNVLSDMMRLQALQPEEIDKQLPTLLQPIQAQSEQLSTFEKEAAGTKV